MSEVHRERVHELVKDKALKLMQSDRLDIFEMSFKTGAERLYLTAIAAERGVQLSNTRLPTHSNGLLGSRTSTPPLI
jgi:hypothetical protein